MVRNKSSGTNREEEMSKETGKGKEEADMEEREEKKGPLRKYNRSRGSARKGWRRVSHVARGAQ